MQTKVLTSLVILASTGIAADSAAVERLRAAADVFQEIQHTPDKGIPDSLLQKANGIIIVPGLKRAGFVFGGEYGKGVFVVRLPDGHWSAPSTVRIEGGSFGAQIGAGETDLVMLAMNQDAVRQLMRVGVKIGGDVMAAAGPVGRKAEAATTPIPAAGLLAYSRARGIFAGATVNGTTLRSDDDDNETLYGKKVTQSDILTGKLKTPTEAQPLMNELQRYFVRNPSDERPPERVK